MPARFIKNLARSSVSCFVHMQNTNLLRDLTYITARFLVSSQNDIRIATVKLPIILFGPMSHLDEPGIAGNISLHQNMDIFLQLLNNDFRKRFKL